MASMSYVGGQRKRNWTPPQPYTLAGKELIKVKVSLNEATGKIVIVSTPNNAELSGILKRIGDVREIEKENGRSVFLLEHSIFFLLVGVHLMPVFLGCICTFSKKFKILKGY